MKVVSVQVQVLLGVPEVDTLLLRTRTSKPVRVGRFGHVQLTPPQMKIFARAMISLSPTYWHFSYFCQNSYYKEAERIGIIRDRQNSIEV